MIKVYLAKIQQQPAFSDTFTRRCIAHHLNVSEYDLRFGLSEKEKPQLLNYKLQFNRSHSGEYIVVALSDKEIGVDIEKIKKRNPDGIVKRYFQKEEQDYLANIPEYDKINEFVSIWTCKEAYLKLIGTGLANNIEKYGIIFDSDKKIRVTNHFGEPVFFKQYNFSNDYKLTVCAYSSDFPADIMILQ